MDTTPIVLADADNTLWDTDAIFASAQVSLLTSVENATGKCFSGNDRLSFVREYDQAIAARHHLHFRYPRGMLARALRAGLECIPPSKAADDIVRGRSLGVELPFEVLDSLVVEFDHALRAEPILLPGVREGLEDAKEKGLATYVLTEGHVRRQNELVDHLALRELVNGVLEVTKNERQFIRLKTRFSPASIYVIGDQIDRDIAPALAAGCAAILVPSRFRPRSKDGNYAANPSHIASDFAHAISWVVERERSRT